VTPPSAQGLRPASLTFYGAPPCAPGAAPDADVAFVGVPFDLGTTLRPGARFGPAAVRAASAWYRYIDDDGNAAGGWFDLDLGRWILQGITMADCGDVEIAPADITANLERISAATIPLPIRRCARLPGAARSTSCSLIRIRTSWTSGGGHA